MDKIDFERSHSRKEWIKNSDYHNSSRFTSFLIKKFTKKRLLEFLVSLEKENTADSASKKMEEKFGHSLNQCINLWVKSTKA